MTMANDSLEGKVLRDILERRYRLSSTPILDINHVLEVLERSFDGLAFCLSKKEDMLSQWRGYADDGMGFSIGFTEEFLRNTSWQDAIHFKDVVYDLKAQEALLKPIFEIVEEAIRAQASSGSLGELLEGDVDGYEERLRAESQISSFFSQRFFDLAWSERFTLKHAAFQEEEESRLIHVLSAKTFPHVRFRPDRGKLMPYIENDIPNGVRAVESVFVGPKNTTPLYLIEEFLRQNLFTNVSVKKSESSYR
ncbi:MAG: DUF2971 domain-containing protein [Pseudomonadota bacterium]